MTLASSIGLSLGAVLHLGIAAAAAPYADTLGGAALLFLCLTQALIMGTLPVLDHLATRARIRRRLGLGRGARTLRRLREAR